MEVELPQAKREIKKLKKTKTIEAYDEALEKVYSVFEDKYLWFLWIIKKESNIIIGSCGFQNWVKDHNRS